jgi:parvulin-like peptidyl-prolyl isomerase
LFSDEPDAGEAVAAARRGVLDDQDELTLAAALDISEVAELLNTYDLLWFAPDEVTGLAGAMI